MIRINLLPWREELRQQRQKNFMAAFVGTIIAAALLVFLGSYLVGKQISGQQNRNSYLQGEIKKLDRDIASIEGLEATRDSLLARKNVIEQLQENRSLMVHLFNSLATTVPEGIRLSTVGQRGSRSEERRVGKEWSCALREYRKQENITLNVDWIRE